MKKLFFLTLALLSFFRLSAQPADTLSEAVVRSHAGDGLLSPRIGTVRITGELVGRTPAALGEPDLLKTLQLLPGVQSGNDGFSNVYIRGGGQDETLYLMDGVPVYGFAHALGLMSAFAPETVSAATLYKGPFPARFGGRMSGVVDMHSDDGDMRRFRGSISVGLLSDRLHLEGPAVRDRLSFSVSVRVLHTLLAAPLIKWLDGDMNYFFYDFSGKLSWRISDTDLLSVSAGMGDDRFYGGMRSAVYGENSSEPDYWRNNEADMAWGNRTASLHWSHDYGDALSSEAGLFCSSYRSASDWTVTPEAENELKTVSTGSSAITDIGAAMDFDWRISSSHILRFGFSAVHHNFSPDGKVSFGNSSGGDMLELASGLEAAGWENAVYVEDELSLGERLKLDLGLRGVLMSCGKELFWSLEPRISATADLGAGFAVKAAAGRGSQYVHLLSSSMTAFTAPTDIWMPSTGKLKPVIGGLFSAGAGWNRNGWELSLEGYLRHSDNVIDWKDGTAPASAAVNGFEEQLSVGEARSKGLEFMAHRTRGRTTGWISYTLSKTDRRFPDGSVNAGRWFPDTYDRRHNLALYVNHRFSERLDLSASWVFMSGSMTTVPDGVTAAIASGSDSPELLPQVSSRNNYRLPPTHRLNLSLNLRKSGRLGESVWAFGIYNVYNAMNPNLILYMQTSDFGRYGYKAVKLTFLPVTPSISYTFNF